MDEERKLLEFELLRSYEVRFGDAPPTKDEFALY